jgi:hypothetical protein
MIPKQSLDLYSSPYGAVPFALLAALLLGGAVLVVIRARRLPVPLRISFGSLLIGLCVEMSYEADAVWQQSGTPPTISRITNDAFAAHRYVWGAIFLAVILLGGLLTMHFTRVVQKPQLAEWNLLVTAVLFLLNGAVIAYWFNWLP